MRILFVLTMLAAGVYADSEKKVKMQDLPPAVQQAVKDQLKGASLKGLAKEVEGGKTLYEAEMTVNGHGRDVSFDETGKVVSVEEEVALESIPVPAREALQKAAGTGKITKVESVTEKGTNFFEAQVKKGTKTSEVKVDAAGKTVK